MSTGVFSTATNYGRRRPRKTMAAARAKGRAKALLVKRAKALEDDAKILAEHAKGGSRKEIAGRLGMSEERFKKRLNAARKRQREDREAAEQIAAEERAEEIANNGQFGVGA